MPVYLRDRSAHTMCYHTEIEVADQIFYPTQSQYTITDNGPASPSADPITPGALQGSQWSANFEVTGMTQPRKITTEKVEIKPGSAALNMGTLVTRPTRWWSQDATKQFTKQTEGKGITICQRSG